MPSTVALSAIRCFDHSGTASGPALPMNAPSNSPCARLKRVAWLALFLMTPPVFAQEEPSRLRYTVPDGWTPSIDGRTLLPPGGNAAVTFAPSAPFAGTAEQWIAESWNGIARELKVISGPAPGTQGAFLTRIGLFQQADGSQVWLCLNTRVHEGRGESVIYFARDDAHFRAHFAALSKMLAGATVGAPKQPSTSDNVATPPAPPATPRTPAPAGGDEVAGLHLATTRQLRFNPFGGSGSTDWETRTEYYLLSRDGRVFRGRDLPAVPGGDLARFDFEAARRQAPGNYGTYTVRDRQVILRFPDETITAQRAEADVLEIRGTKFRRSSSASGARVQPESR